MKIRQVKNDAGLIVDTSTNPPTCIGYIFNFQGHGAFDPSGNVGQFTQAEIDNHNRLLEQAERQAMIEQGRGVLYLYKREHGYEVNGWAGTLPPIKVHPRESWHNMAGKRFDVWFTLGGKNWHGVNIGDNQIVRCKATKK